jgi:hypothetical protein
MDGYLVQQPFADQIASGQKQWDVRACVVHLPHNKPFYILSTRRPHPIAADYPQDRLGRIVATARCREVIGPFDVEEMVKYQDKHLIEPDVLRAYSQGRALYAMVLSDAKPVDPARVYRHKQGAVHLLLNVDQLA